MTHKLGNVEWLVNEYYLYGYALVNDDYDSSPHGFIDGGEIMSTQSHFWSLTSNAVDCEQVLDNRKHQRESDYPKVLCSMSISPNKRGCLSIFRYQSFLFHSERQGSKTWLRSTWLGALQSIQTAYIIIKLLSLISVGGVRKKKCGTSQGELRKAWPSRRGRFRPLVYSSTVYE